MPFSQMLYDAVKASVTSNLHLPLFLTVFNLLFKSLYINQTSTLHFTPHTLFKHTCTLRILIILTFNVTILDSLKDVSGAPFTTCCITVYVTNNLAS